MKLTTKGIIITILLLPIIGLATIAGFLYKGSETGKWDWKELLPWS